MWNNQPGDYDGYNERFGGLPAFRKAMEEWKASGTLMTLYTGRSAATTTPSWARRAGWASCSRMASTWSYDVWNMCHDVAEYRKWVARTMERVLRETGADGIRLDEYGHQGWACFSPHHRHTFAEPGCTEWQRSIAEATKLVRQAMDRVDPTTVLTTEHPGYDYLLPFLDGCITYDLTVQRTPLRPLECNLQRFYFPECKAYELDHMGADPTCRKRLWNGVAFFGATPPRVIYAIFQENNDVLAGRACEPLVPPSPNMSTPIASGQGRRPSGRSTTPPATPSMAPSWPSRCAPISTFSTSTAASQLLPPPAGCRWPATCPATT